MQYNFKKSFLAILAVLALCFQSGCGGKTAGKSVYDREGEAAVCESGQIAENGKFRLFWDSDKNTVMLRSEKTGEILSSVPYEFLNSGVTSGIASVNLTSPLTVTYIDPETLAAKEVKGSVGAIKNGRVSSERIEDGIRVVYYFDELGFSIPVHFTLCDAGLKVSLKVNEIVETDYPIYQISLMPYMASAKNSDDSYLLVPSGSGALIKTYEREAAVKYSEEVYGEDPVGVSYASTDSFEGVRLPVFGVKSGDKAMLAIIDEGAECAAVEATVGDAEIGWSSVFATFRIRGYDLTKIADHTGLYKYIKKFSDEHVLLDSASVIYSPIEDEEPNYVGMAKHYRAYLANQGFLKTEANAAPLLSLNIWGGAMTRKLILGFPYYSYTSYTDLSGAEKILTELNSLTGQTAVVNLRGFLGGGLTPDKAGGGFKLAGAAGSKKDLAALKEKCKELGNILFLDYDLIRFSRSGGGYKVISDTVKTANKVRSSQKYYNPATNTKNKSVSEYFLLSRKALDGISDKLVKGAQRYGVDGISLASLSSVAYSDYGNRETYCKNGMGAVASKIISAAGEKYAFLGENANLYAAVLSDYLTYTPYQSSGFDCFDTDVPFYQILFKGYIPIYGSAVNSADDPETAFLKSVECGAGLQFSVAGKYSAEDNYLPYSALASADFEDLKSVIADYSEKASEYYSLVANSAIKRHNVLGNLHTTTFENGITVYVNYGAEPQKTPLGTVEPDSFIYGKE